MLHIPDPAILILKSEGLNLQDYFHRQIEFITLKCILYHTLDILYEFPYNIYQEKWKGTRPLTRSLTSSIQQYCNFPIDVLEQTNAIK